MAEAIYNKFSSGAQSAGIDQAGGNYSIDPNVLTVLNEIGIETKNLKAKKVTEEMMEHADQIIAFRCAEHIPEKYRFKVSEWELGVKREPGRKQTERTLDEIRKMRDLNLEKVKKEILKK